MAKPEGVTYEREVTSAVDRLTGALDAASAAPWEAVADTHSPGRVWHSLWSEGDGKYVAETMGEPGDARYLQIVDPFTGLLVAALLRSFLIEVGDLNQVGGHEKCRIGACNIASLLAVSRYINSRPS
jgi:hypothetical protein